MAASVIPLIPNRPNALLLERSDDDLMLLAAGGMAPAFDVLVCRHQQALMRSAAKQLRDSSLARDVTQSTFLELHRSLPKYQPQGRFKAFLYRILINQCRLATRKKTHPTVSADEADDPIDPRCPEDVVLRREQRLRLERAMKQLSDKLRVVIVLRFTADLNHNEISQVLDIPVGTVKSRLFIGLEELSKLLHGDEL